MSVPTPAQLADGRSLLFFPLPGNIPAPVADQRPLPPRDARPSQLRFDQSTGQWVIIAALRQDRTYKPPTDQCPLCPGPTGLTSEVPAADYDVVVFENRFPSLAGVAESPLSVPADLSATPLDMAAVKSSAFPVTTPGPSPTCIRRMPDWWSRRGDTARLS